MSKVASIVAEIKAIRAFARSTGRTSLVKALDDILEQCDQEADRAYRQLAMQPIVSMRQDGSPVLTWVDMFSHEDEEKREHATDPD